MINVQDLTMRIGARQLVAGASYRVDKGMRIGLVGRNGAGKTTMTKLLAAQSVVQGTSQAVADADETHGLQAVEHEGTISCNGSVGYLPQDTKVGDLEEVARDRILSARGIDALLARIRKAEERISTTQGDAMAKALDRYTRLDHEFTMAGGYAAASEAARIAAALGLPDRVLNQPIGTLSGGQRRRVELARVLFQQPDTLLLDEPTNHLDHDSVLWLRDHLRTYAGGFIVISHDVELLRDTVNQIMYLDANRGVLDVYHLGWDAYLRQRAEDEARRRKERANAEKKAAALRAQGEKMRAKATKAVAAQQMLRRAERLLEGLDEQRAAEKVAHLRFPDPAPCGKTPLRASRLSKAYGSLEVFSGVDLAIDRGSRVVVLGLNGAGKTTMLRILAGVETPDSGEVVPGHGLKIGYYAQEHETIDTDRTVVENLRSAAPDMDDTQVRSVLGSFLFSGADADKPARVLSGGEKTRLALAILVVSSANVLLLDEPTNNLDPASREEILRALGTFEGAVVLVTHDEGAVEALEPDRVLLLPDGDEDLWGEEYLEFVTLA
ncbi:MULTISPECIES: ABC-F family ATP-binding cassette domain-containing protein [unclassified Actinomyces]|uniref:ABC-F family ATP-binding cassette domain-containing protein n=1 Tax=unclassified Actinomyces TaxID=2609248 RepID=UPI002016ABEA|nr:MULTISPECIES: ABC-F family ATP-binding cassette domain-containing protein [unclassified Actinomyces]MCL3777576.1 ABC-F family ATP-binding cassette domain-containing protein [Actinomyces sp. AC-20-1]MCL3789555.1 ABC-F family ATP-binding cassette domain-containing protein [Actinomyces sp. 187325]MCL3791083.1 ABC-F family ATP-binding cassette domain-containing protein [Actinomyces sp. 186855]MCL3793391.1 ABC-F family ATP-binding cassette domain-containing protein [Actinomyces sp. 217892]